MDAELSFILLLSYIILLSAIHYNPNGFLIKTRKRFGPELMNRGENLSVYVQDLSRL